MAEFSLTPVGSVRDPVLDVIFVHALGSDPAKTWTNDADVYWPEWLLDLPGVAAWALAYPAHKTRWGEDGKGLDLRQVGRTACSHVADHGLFELPTAWVAHGLGGLVVKQILRVGTLGDAQLAKAIESTVSVAFLATPHRGSDLATTARRLKVVRPSEIALDLVPGDTGVQELNDWFRQHALASRLSVLAFAETKPIATLPGNLGSTGLIVETGSADPEIVGALVRHVPEDHFSIAKPSSPTDVVPFAIGAQIRRVLEAERVRERAQSTELG